MVIEKGVVYMQNDSSTQAKGVVSASDADTRPAKHSLTFAQNAVLTVKIFAIAGAVLGALWLLGIATS